jgi:hypothetical protein
VTGADDRLLPNLDVGVAWEVAFLFAFLVALAIVALSLFGWLLYRSGQLSHPAPLIVSLALLTAVALIGGMATRSTDVLNLAAVGFGALAGSLAVVFRAEGRNSKAPPPRSEGEGAGDPTEGTVEPPSEG